MRAKDTLRLAARSVRRDKIRTALTVIGVIIGIFIIVLVIGIANGAIASVEEEFKSFGNDKLFVVAMPEKAMLNPLASGRGVMGKLYKKDVNALKGIPYIDAVAYAVWQRARVEFKKESVDASVYAVSGAKMFQMWDDYFKLKEGRFLKDNDGYSVLLGHDAAYELFSKEVRVGDRIKINGVEFRVVGVLKKIGTALSQTDDQAIYIPYSKAREVFGNSIAKDEVSFIVIDTTEEKVDEVKKAVEERIARSHKVKLSDKDFSVITSAYIRELTSSILNLLYTASIAVTAIASVVGGIGISNTMFTSVVEKKREIGIMKAVGAKNKDIVKLFLAESAIIGGIGSLAGLVGALIVGFGLRLLGIPFQPSISVALLSLLYGIAIGVIAGIIPAKQATKVPPVEAMRY